MWSSGTEVTHGLRLLFFPTEGSAIQPGIAPFTKPVQSLCTAKCNRLIPRLNSQLERGVIAQVAYVEACLVVMSSGVTGRLLVLGLVELQLDESHE